MMAAFFAQEATPALSQMEMASLFVFAELISANTHCDVWHASNIKTTQHYIEHAMFMYEFMYEFLGSH